MISTKSSEIDFEEPSVQEIVPKKDEEKRSNQNISVSFLLNRNFFLHYMSLKRLFVSTYSEYGIRNTFIFH